MRKVVLPGSLMLTFGLMLGLAGCSSGSSSSSSSAATAVSVHKTSFCAGNLKIDRASVNVNSESGFLTVLKDNKSALEEMTNNLPSGSLGSQARQEITAAQSAIASGNTTALNNVPQSAGGDIDTYCGVDGAGNPLPTYFATGKGTSFCKTFVPIYNDVSNASSAAGTLQVLVSNKAQIDQLATEVSGLPSSIRAKASQTVSNAQTAISENSTAALNQNGNGPASSVALYCGQNQ
jgi:hypothetical protein